MKCLITGAKGQLGTELSNLLKERNIEFLGLDSKALDVTDRQQVIKVVSSVKPDIIFHCAAYTAVDAAEDENRDLNWKVNVVGTENVAYAARDCGATLVYISTDYVFDGSKQTEYQVDDITNPETEYGRSKLAGEKAVEKVLTNYYIIRTSWVFGEYGHNFVYTMLQLSKTHDKLNVVDDQVGRPTWTRTLAEFMIYLVQNKADFGLYQLSNEGSCSWFEFAQAILRATDTQVLPVTSDEYPQKAKRPAHSILSLEKAKQTGFQIIDWKSALDLFQDKLESNDIL